MADPVRQHKLVVIENSLLDSLAASDRFTAEFPFLKGLSQGVAGAAPRRCSSCGGGAAAAVRSRVHAGAKAALAAMASGKKQKLKELLNTKHVRIVYQTDSGKIISLTF